MATSLKNAAAGATKVVEAFLQGRKAREGSRTDYKPGARYETDGTNLIQWGSIIARKVNGSIEITDAGWRTKTTMAMLNAVLYRAAMNVQLYQKSHQWFLSTPDGAKPWNGKAVVKLDGGSVLGNRKKGGAGGWVLQSANWIYAPGFLKWVQHGYATSSGKLKAKFAKYVSITWASVPASVSKGIAAGTIPYRVVGENVHIDKPGKSVRLNPLTKFEAARALKLARYHIGEGKRRKGYPITAAMSLGRAQGISEAVRVFGPGKALSVARKISDRAEHVRGLHLPNPLSRAEAARALRWARGEIGEGRRTFKDGLVKIPAYSFGRARGVAGVVRVMGPKAATAVARKMGERAERGFAAMKGVAHLSNGLSCLKNLHTARERDNAARLIHRYWVKGKAALVAGKMEQAAHAYGALAAIRRLAQFAHAQRVAELAALRMVFLKQNARDFSRYRKGGR